MAEKVKKTKRKGDKYSYLLKNIGLLTISNFGTKILSFVLIPIYTSVLSTADYGTYDIYTTTILLLTPLLTFNVVEGIMRFVLDKEKDKRSVFSIGFKHIVVVSLFFALIVSLNKMFNVIEIFTDYWVEFILLFIFEMLYDLQAKFARGIEQVKHVAIAGAINGVVMMTSNILFLVVFKFGLKGYFYAAIISYAIPILYYIFALRIWRYMSWRYDKTLAKEMYRYCVPLIMNNISWWVINVSDRYVVTWLRGVSENGVYSIAYKIPSILSIVQNIFSQAWTISSVKEYSDPVQRQKFYSEIYLIYNAGMVIVCSMIVLLNQIIALILFKQEFYGAWVYAPFLVVSTVFGALSGLLGGIFSAAKKPLVFSISTIIGAAINIGLDILLVYYYGAIGAAIATLVAYVLIWGIRLVFAKRMVNLKINLIRDIISYFLIIGQGVIWVVSKYINIPLWLIYSAEGAIFLIIIILYLKDAIHICKKTLQRIRSPKQKEKEEVSSDSQLPEQQTPVEQA